MKYLLFVSLFLMIPVLETGGQSGAKETKPPKEVVAEFWKLETEGGRLTPEGWYKAGNSFFVRSSPFPQKNTIGVISAKYKYSVDEKSVKENHAEIVNEVVDLGRIDDALRYTRPDSRYYKTDVIHHLVLADKHLEIAPDGVTEKEVSGGPLAWRIENPEPLLWLTVDTAIRYVKETREKSTDTALKRNADHTLAQLKALR